MSVSSSAGSCRHDGQLRDAVALHEVDRGAHLLVRVDDDEVGELRPVAVLARITCATVGAGARRSMKPYWIIQLSS